MKTYKYKLLSLFMMVAVCVSAQTHDKKIKENFKVNSDVELEINSTHADVDIQTWNKNEVSIEAVMEVEGVSKEEADKILKAWKFEALGNKSKVQIKSYANRMFFEFDGDFDFDFDFEDMDIEIPEIEFEEIELPEMDFEIPEIDIVIPEIIIPEIEIPEIEIESFDYDAYQKDSTYLKKYKERVAKQVEKFNKSDWKVKIDSFKNSDEYKKQIEAIKIQSKKIAEQYKNADWQKKMQEKLNSEEFKKQMKEAQRVAEEVRKEMLENKVVWEEQARVAREAADHAREIIIKMKEEGKFDSLKKAENSFFYKFEGGENSKVKIKRTILIKVPKNAKFDLNVRHGKLNVPESKAKMSANVQYGKFIAGVIEGAKNDLTIANSWVEVKSMNDGNITLKNVPNASFGTFYNANLFSNYSEVKIALVGQDVALSQRFGNILVEELVPDFNNLNLIVDYGKAKIKMSETDFVYKINDKSSNFEVLNDLSEVKRSTSNGVNFIEGFSKNKASNNNFLLTGVFSTIVLN